MACEMSETEYQTWMVRSAAPMDQGLGYVRGGYNAMTPYYRQHAIAQLEDAYYVTECGLYLHESSAVSQTPWVYGDRCENGCTFP